MSKSKMLQEAIADAKAVKSTAMANAKAALEEAFTPRLQSMISAKLQQEMDDEEMEGEEEYEDEMDAEMVADMDVDMEDEVEEGSYEEGMYNEDEDEMEAEMDDEMDDEMDVDMEDEEDLELEAIIRELEGEMDDEEMEDDEELEEEYDKSTGIGNSDNSMDQVSSSNVTNDDDLYEEIDINEIIAALREDLDGDGMPDEGEAMDDDTAAGESMEESLQAELEEAYNTIETMKSSLNETNLLNAKLLFSNKLFKAYDLNESQKLKVIDNFDRAETLREVKLVYATLAESMKAPAKRRVNESASKPVASTAPKKDIISEGNTFQSRMQKLANIKK
jgi:hypothetical protein